MIKFELLLRIRLIHVVFQQLKKVDPKATTNCVRFEPHKHTLLLMYTNNM